LEDESDEEEDKANAKQEEGEEEKTNGETKPEKEVKMEAEEEEEEVKKEPEEEEDDIDPLDAYMMTVQEEVCKINKFGKVADAKEKQNSAQSGVVIMMGTAKKKDSSKNKGELIEQNQDGLEVTKHTIIIFSSTFTNDFSIRLRRKEKICKRRLLVWPSNRKRNWQRLITRRSPTTPSGRISIRKYPKSQK
jgi:hypothetical protein